MTFEGELKNGRLAIPWCEACSRIVWPPTDYCSRCLGDIVLRRGDPLGKIIEFSAKDGRYFGIVEFEDGFRVMATIEGAPILGRQVRIKECGAGKDGYFFTVH